MLALQLQPVQNFVAQKASQFLSRELSTKIEIESIYLKPFSSIQLNKLYIEDRSKDTLLYVEDFSAQLDFSSIWRSKLTMNESTLVNGKIFIRRRADSTTNFSFIQDYFSPSKERPTDDSPSKFDFVLPSFNLQNITFRYKNDLKSGGNPNGINYNDVDVYALTGVLNNIDYVNHLFQASIEDLTFREKSGIWVKALTTDITVDSNKMEFSKLDLALNSSYLKDYILFEYDSLADFSNFINKVSIKGNLKDSRITSRDIAYFAPQVSVTSFDVLVNGDFSGLVNNISAQEIQIRTGKQTWLQGNVSIKGLPYINQTLFDMELSSLVTTRIDLENIIAQLSGKQVFELPKVFDRFGQLTFKGGVTGFYNDFIAKGIFSTKLGDVFADVNLEITGLGKYSGEVFSNNFNLGGLLQNNDVGFTSLRAEVKGSGFKFEDLEEHVDASIKFIDFKGHRYQNIEFTGTLIDRFISGDIGVQSSDLMADLTGDLDMREESPRLNVYASVEEADLRALNFTEDSIDFSGNLESNLIGSNLSNITGRLLVSDLTINRPDASSHVDSILIIADRLAGSRALTIQSDVVDGNIVGEFDLLTLPSYFKSVAKRYLPTWQTKIEESGRQEFEVELVVKNFEPLTMLLIPDVTIDDEVIVNGVFSSEDSTATVNGFIPVITYKGIKANNLIFDQTTNENFLNFFITADRIDLTDSLYIDNVNFANVLRNDSLRFNLKLSDRDATNQLDLNGLIEFDENASARLSILPSDIIINQEEWRIQEKVRVNFEQGKTLVNGLEFTQGEQVVAVNGAVSGSDEDILTVSFHDFLLKTFNPIAQSAGIELAGLMNGQVEIRSLLKNPFVQSDLKAEGIEFNNTLIGDLNLWADVDQTTSLVNLRMDVSDKEKRTLDLEGTYNAKSEENSLDLAMELHDAQVILFTPFLRKLVSDLSGSASASLTVSGTPFNPVINGTAELNDVGMVVNYLRTPYRINDEVEISNSTIVINDLELQDRNNNTARANGSVDMSKPLTPTIHVDIDADNFMVLNTTSKDNPLYYGLAFGTGKFSFHGPTNDMDITIQARTNENTEINIPLNAAGSVIDKDFITFVSKDTAEVISQTNYFQGLTMVMDLTVNPEAKINIITDLGKLSGRGEGLLSMNITSLGDFEMFGDYAIQQGEFEFTAQDFINKIFEIDRGGSIRWTGNPSEALINLTAIYQVRTSVRPLYIAAGRAGTDQRVLAEAEMILNGNLLHPEISFGLDFPTDSYINDELQSYLSDANNVNQQALSLIVRRSFAPGTGTDLTRELNTTVFSAGTELAFNQLNNIISQSLNLNFVDFNIRSFNEASASIRLLNDRIILTGGVTDRRGQLNDFNVFGKDVASDVEALYLIRKSGNLLFRASNRLSNRNFLNPEEEYVSALGLVYRQEFDTFGEFLRRIISIRSRKVSADSLQLKSDTTTVDAVAD